MKRWGAFFFVLVSLMITTKWVIEYQAQENNRMPSQKTADWEGHIKKSPDSPPSVINHISEADRRYLPQSNEQSRKPGSISKSKESQQQPQKKKIIGRSQVMTQELMLINDPRADWKDVFVERMLTTQKPETKIFIKHQGQAYIVRDTKARAVEEVLVTFRGEDESVSSYMAWVDSETGSLIRTWSRTHNHNFREKASRLTPTGSL